jgi:hypothetical protein
MGLFEQLKEDVRAADAAAVLKGIGVERLGPDDRYWQEHSYAFHLHIGEAPPLVFPLVLNPQSIRKVHPFAAELTPAQEGGVIAEENGVLISDLVITGHTGMRPRLNEKGGGPALPLSGQAHFLHLQDACFLRYAALKKDPAVAPKVYMTFHNYKDSEHWIVVPKMLSLDRSVAKNFQYHYSIQLSLIEEIKNQTQAPKEDHPVFAAMKDAVTNIVRAVATVQAVVLEVTGFIEEIEGAAGGFVVDVLADVTQMVGFVNAFITGQASFIRFPVQAMRTLSVNIGTIISATDPNKALSLPYDVTAAFLEMQDGVLRLMAYPDKFREDWNAAGQRFLQLTQGPARASTTDLDAAETSTITQAASLETSALRPGDPQRVRAGVFDLPATLPRYTGFREVTVLFGDSLPSIAARELGDARRWLDLALANDLKSPYISEEGVPGTLRPGQPILIPTTEPPTPTEQVRSAGNPEEGTSQLEALFGTDFQLAPQADGSYDLVVNPGTKTDFVTLSGLDNISQAVSTILSVDKGSYLLHLAVGLDRIAGRPGTVERVIEARSRVVEAIQRDPRVESVRNANFRLVNDTLEVDVEVQTTDTSPLRVIGRVIS